MVLYFSLHQRLTSKLDIGSYNIYIKSLKHDRTYQSQYFTVKLITNLHIINYANELISIIFPYFERKFDELSYDINILFLSFLV